MVRPRSPHASRSSGTLRVSICDRVGIQGNQAGTVDGGDDEVSAAASLLLLLLLLLLAAAFREPLPQGSGPADQVLRTPYACDLIAALRSNPSSAQTVLAGLARRDPEPISAALVDVMTGNSTHIVKLLQTWWMENNGQDASPYDAWARAIRWSGIMSACMLKLTDLADRIAIELVVESQSRVRRQGGGGDNQGNLQGCCKQHWLLVCERCTAFVEEAFHRHAEGGT